MNFLSKTLSTLTGTSIPYTVKEEIPTSPKSIWTVYNGLNPKGDNSPVSIFEMNLRNDVNINRNYVSLARNCFKKLKLVKFPGIISIIDFIENDNYLYIITEPVIPLQSYLKQYGNEVGDDAKIYGIYNIGETLDFINMKCQCVHGSLSVYNDSVFVNKLGEWKLFGFELLTNLTSDPDQAIYRLSGYSPSFQDELPGDVSNQGIEAIRGFPIRFDSYKYGIFIHQIFNQGIDFNNIGKMPKQLSVQYKKLINPKLNLRISIQAFLKETGKFFESNKVIQFNKQLEEIQFKNDFEKLNFFKFELSNYVGEDIDIKFPPGFLDFKLLPELINQYNNLLKPNNAQQLVEDLQQRQETTSVLLNYILKFGVKLNKDEFCLKVKPIILNAFQSADRSIRLILLTHLSSYIENLTDGDIQSKVFYNLITGFQDTNFMIRETTLTSIMIIIDKVSVKQVNQDLLKVLAKSQMDPKPSIRTNTLVLIIKISDKIYQNSKNNVLITALSKSLRDSFIPCKMTSLSGFEKLINEFSLEEICSKILGQLAILLMDNQSYKVRKEAKRIFELYLDMVEKHASTLPRSENEDDEDAEEKEFFKKYAPNNNGLAQQVSQASQDVTQASKFNFGWGMVNKLVASSELEGELNNDFNSSTPDLTRVTTPTISNKREPATSFANDIINDDDLDDGWGDELNNLSLQDKPSEKLSTIRSTTRAPTKTNNNSRKTSSLKLGTKKDTTRKPPGSTLKLDLTINDDVEDGWGGW